MYSMFDGQKVSRALLILFQHSCYTDQNRGIQPDENSSAQAIWTFCVLMVCNKKVLCPQNLFGESRKDTKVICPIMWTYDICTFDTGTYYDY